MALSRFSAKDMPSWGCEGSIVGVVVLVAVLWVVAATLAKMVSAARVAVGCACSQTASAGSSGICCGGGIVVWSFRWFLVRVG